jgi:hypothetical protein
MCETAPTGDFVENEPPSTFLTVDRINREGDFRLSSQIKISWWGTDGDGYIVGYEYAINDTSDGNWVFTEKTDSTFILPITPGLEQDDVLFKVRAIDNDGERDIDGARLVFPIVNSAPSVSLNQNETPPDTLFSIASFGWSLDDPDGLGNLLSTEVAVNDTINGWVDIPIPTGENRLFISLEIDNSLTGATNADVFQGRSFTRLVGLSIPGIQVGATNTFYVRTTDNAGAVSNVDSVSWYVKPQQSRTLFLNDYSGTNSATNADFHLNLLNQNGITPDIWIINDGDVSLGKVALSEAFPAVIDPTLKKTLAKWDHIYWLSNDIDRNITYALDITTEFFDNGGSMFVNIPMKGIGQNDEIFNFIPVDSIGVLTGIQTNFLLNANTPVTTVAPFTGAELLTDRRVVGNYPLKPISGATLLYETDYKATTVIGFIQDYLGFEGVAIENPEGNLIYFGVDLQLLTRNANIPDVLEDLLVNRLNFKQ